MITTTTPHRRTDRQVRYIVDLLRQIAEVDPTQAEQLWTTLRETDRKSGLTVTQASDTITTLKEQVAALSVPRVPEGRYAVDNEEDKTGFYRVRFSQTGSVIVSVYASDQQIRLPWKTAQSVLRKIEQAGLQQALERFGRERRVCPHCGHQLTDEESRSRGIGPVCAAKRGL